MNKLALASFWVVVSLLGLIFGVGMALLLKLHLPLGVMLGSAAAFAFLVVFVQYMIGPPLIDWIVRTNWADPCSVSDDFAEWFRKTCKSFSIPEPRFGIIEDGAPNAFTYGHGAYDARVVVTRGVIDMLSPDELRSVVAHELGHIKHRDFILMTVVQGLVLALYTLYIAARYSGNRNSIWVVLVSYVAYQLSYYVSLYLSRVREYMADYASAHIMGTGNPLSVALVKICYGLAHSKPAQAPAPSVFTQTHTNPSDPLPSGSPVAFTQRTPTALDNPMMGISAMTGRRGLFGTKTGGQQRKTVREATKLEPRTLGAFGIAGTSAMRTAVAWTGANGQPDPQNFTRAARWELYNPWSRIAELISTHPMTVRRIQALQKLNRMWGVSNVFDFSKIKPAKYRGFGRDLLLLALPILLATVAGVATYFASPLHNFGFVLAAVVLGGSVGGLIAALAMFPGGNHPAKVMDCLAEVDVSQVKPIPVVLHGTFTGRVSPGVFWASDFILQDDTGFVTCLIRMPFGLQSLFGWLRAASFVGQPVTVYGWYRRFTAPYVDVDYFVSLYGGRTSTYRRWAVVAGPILGILFAALIAAVSA